MHTNIAAINTFGKIAVLHIKSIADGGVGLVKNTTTTLNSNKFQAQKWSLPKLTKFFGKPSGGLTYCALASLAYSDYAGGERFCVFSYLIPAPLLQY